MSRFGRLSRYPARVLVQVAVLNAVEDGARLDTVASRFDKLFRRVSVDDRRVEMLASSVLNRESVVSSGFVGIAFTEVLVDRELTAASRF